MRWLLLVCFSFFAYAGPALARPIAAEDLVKLWTYEVAVSASGKTLIAGSRGDERTLTVDQAPVTVPGTNPGPFVWSRDGSRFAYFATDGGKRALFVSGVGKVCDAERSNAYLAHQGTYVAWSPDGLRLAFVGTPEPEPAKSDPVVITRIQYKTRTAISDNRRSHILVVDAAAGVTPRAVTTGEFDEHSIAWGGDGSEIVFLSNRAKDPDAVLEYDI